MGHKKLGIYKGHVVCNMAWSSCVHRVGEFGLRSPGGAQRKSPHMGIKSELNPLPWHFQHFSTTKKVFQELQMIKVLMGYHWKSMGLQNTVPVGTLYPVHLGRGGSVKNCLCGVISLAPQIHFWEFSWPNSHQNVKLRSKKSQNNAGSLMGGNGFKAKKLANLAIHPTAHMGRGNLPPCLGEMKNRHSTSSNSLSTK